MLMEVVDPEPLTGDHVPFRKETGKSEFMEGERGVVVKKGRQCQSKEAFSGERKSTGDSVVIIEKGEQCQSLKTFSGGRKSAGERVVVIGKGEQCQSQETLPAERKSTGAEVPVVRRSVSVNVTDAVTQSITDDVGMSGCRPSRGCSVFGELQTRRDNCKGTGPYCWDPGGVSAVNERC